MLYKYNKNKLYIGYLEKLVNVQYHINKDNYGDVNLYVNVEKTGDASKDLANVLGTAFSKENNDCSSITLFSIEDPAGMASQIFELQNIIAQNK